MDALLCSLIRAINKRSEERQTMSHITSVEIELNDLEAVRALCREKGWQFMTGQKTYRWFGQFVGDSPMPAGMTLEDLGKCDHAIKVPGADYEIGLRATGKGSYKLAFDHWCSGGLEPVIGRNGGLFVQGYGICKTELAAKRNGMVARRVPGKNGAVKLLLTGGSLR
jgi:hypothetical protein